MKSARGFTLVEILVAIVILSVVTLVGISSYNSASVKARDNIRKRDLTTISQALELYYQKNKSYPITSGWVRSNSSQPWITGLDSEFINTVPKDPQANGGDPWDGGMGYAYCANCHASDCPSIAPGQFYALVALLENTSDPDRNANKDYKWCNNFGLSTFYTWHGQSYIFTSQY